MCLLVFIVRDWEFVGKMLVVCCMDCVIKWWGLWWWCRWLLVFLVFYLLMIIVIFRYVFIYEEIWKLDVCFFGFVFFSVVFCCFRYWDKLRYGFWVGGWNCLDNGWLIRKWLKFFRCNLLSNDNLRVWFCIWGFGCDVEW